MSRDHLVVARVGRHSLHPAWLQPHAARSFDLLLCPYQALDPQAVGDATLGDVIAGPKWTGLRQLLQGWDGWRAYRHIWLPDDDLLVDQAGIDRLFALAEALRFALCQPALHPASYYAHFTTLRNSRCTARRTGFVEIMAPCFSRAALEQLLPTLDHTPTGWGWGLDSLWPKLLDYRGVGILDAAPVLHTRPVGSFRDAALGQAVRAESDQIMATYRCRQVHTTFAAIDADLRTLDLAPDALTALLVDGWRPHWLAEPALLPWIVESQRPAGGWPAYPIAGWPSGGLA